MIRGLQDICCACTDGAFDCGGGFAAVESVGYRSGRVGDSGLGECAKCFGYGEGE